jgi:hypothetical protein
MVLYEGKQQSSPLPKEVVVAWEKAGAQAVWMGWDESRFTLSFR